MSTSKPCRAVASPRAVNVEDLRPLARRRLPRAIFDYLDGGAEGEVTLRENRRAFEEVTFRPRQAVPVRDCDPRARVLGFDLSFPALLAPVGFCRVMHPDGDVGAARAAGAAGTVYILSTLSGHRLEDVRAASQGPVWYQLYPLGGRGAAEGALERARAAGFSALVLTVDTPVVGMRERDFRNGLNELLSGSPRERLRFLPQFLARPRWLASFLRDRTRPRFPNIVVPGQGPIELLDVSAALAQAAIVWEDLRWIREAWRGPIVIKGLLTGEDARRAVGEGAEAIVVSNHGGRQLDGVSASLRALPEVVKAVGGRAEVLMDGGVRRGGDILKAICLGARAVLVGRAYAYGLAAAGEAGVSRALEILRDDVQRTLKLLGCRSPADLDRSHVNVPESWQTS
ncbi:MAG: alpha-hydroxy acid oxidase [Acidobacteriota bacterium]